MLVEYHCNNYSSSSLNNGEIDNPKRAGNFKLKTELNETDIRDLQRNLALEICNFLFYNDVIQLFPPSTPTDSIDNGNLTESKLNIFKVIKLSMIS